MIKQSIASVIVAFAVAGAAQAQSAAVSVQPQAVSNDPGTLTVVAACETQMRRLAGLNKALGANYNAQHVHEDCVARTSASTPPSLRN